MFTKIADIQKIITYLPHRYPFLLVDRVVEFDSMTSLTAIKNVTINEPFFQGHFPGLPVMPGVLILEALAQAGGLMIGLSQVDIKDKVFMFTGIDKAKFRRPVVPGDQLVLKCRLTRRKLHIWRMEGQALVDGELAAEAQLTAAIVDKTVL